MKVFCIGFNKTGTSSIHSLFIQLGKTSFHGLYNEWKSDDPRFSQYQCFSDGERHNFRELDKAFPGSKFVLTSRGLSDWLVSRIRHTEIRRTVNKTGWMRKEYESNPQLAVKNWIDRRAPYFSSVCSYFENRPDDLLKLNICDSPNQQNEVLRLLEFLNIDSKSVPELPHVRDSDKITQNLGGGIRSFIFRKKMPRSKEEIRREVESTLEQLGIPESKWGDDGLNSAYHIEPISKDHAGTASTQK